MAVEVVSIFDSGNYQSHIDRAVQLLREGSLVVLPTVAGFLFALYLALADALV